MPKETVLHKKHVARLQREKQQSRMILYTFIGILVIVVLLIGYGILDMNYLQLRKPVAKVGETSIMAKDFEARIRLYRQQLLGQYSTYMQYQQFGLNVEAQLSEIERTLQSPAVIGQTILDQMISEEVIRQEAAKRGITASKAEIEAEKQEVFGYYPDGTPTSAPTSTPFNTPEIPAEAFDIVTITPTPLPFEEFTATPEFTSTPDLQSTLSETLEATATPMPTATSIATATIVPEFTATPAATSTPLPTATPYTREAFDQNFQDAVGRMKELGFNQNQYDALFETQILQKKLKEIITADLKPVEQQVWARHILVEDQAVALSLIGKIQAGEDFASLAKGFSTDTGSGQQGGDLGWFGKGMMVAEFESAAFALEKPGDITIVPVQSQYGYHIIQLIAKQDRPMTEDQFETAKEDAFNEWLEKVKEEYTIETFDFWMERIPSDPNFITMATDAAKQQLTEIAKEKEAAKEATPAP